MGGGHFGEVVDPLNSCGLDTDQEKGESDQDDADESCPDRQDHFSGPFLPFQPECHPDHYADGQQNDKENIDEVENVKIYAHLSYVENSVCNADMD